MVIHMVKNERESGQAVITVPSFAAARLTKVRWTLGPLVGKGGPAAAAGAGGGPATIPAADISVMPVGYVFGGPCPFDARGGGVCPLGANCSDCPQGRPYRCVLGDSHNDTSTCVAAGFPSCDGPAGECIPGGVHNSSIQCIGCSVSQGSINFFNGYRYGDAVGWW